MANSYDRERRLFPTLFDATQHGIRLDRSTLEHHTEVYTKCHDIATKRLAGLLSCGVDAIDNDNLLADALDASGSVGEWTLTATGKRSMAKGSLIITSPEVKILLDYRNQLGTCLQTFMRPWLEFSHKDGRVHPNWNQVRQERNFKSGDTKGAKTGRLSSDSPNFQNVPSEFITQTGDSLPVPPGLHSLPLMRRYCLPEDGHVWIKRDFSSQEVRILAHFEDGTLCEAYCADANLDPHKMAIDLIYQMIGVLYARKSIKITGFSIIYGSGVTGLSGQLGQPYEEAFRIKAAYLMAMPGVKELMEDVQARGRAGTGIRTWGGRQYYTEPSKLVKGRMMDFHYKLLNFLIQGSAADLTKQSINDWDDHRDWNEIFLATVHDEINVSVPKDNWKVYMEKLKRAMNTDRLDVPMLSDGFVGPNWHDLECCE
jgi:DNA polymerase-1